VRVVLTHPYCWPWVRRGSERFIAEFAQFLTSRGREVITISSKPGRGIVEESASGKRIVRPQYWFRWMAKARIQPTHTFLLTSMATLARLDADVVHSLYFTDAFAASVCRRRRGYLTVYQITGPPVPNVFPRMPPDRWLLAEAIRRADRLIVHSRFTQEVVEKYYGLTAEVIPVPVDLGRFPFVESVTHEAPVILSVADFDERRKGVRVLVKAFEQLLHQFPAARLRLSGKISPATVLDAIKPLPAEVRERIEVLGIGRAEDLPGLYGEATVTVLPSMWEAFGMVIVESWACGTPVVVTNHGAFPELVDDPALGVKFEPETSGQETTNTQGLAEAICQAIELARCKATRALCRRRAEEFSWPKVGPRYEAVWGIG